MERLGSRYYKQNLALGLAAVAPIAGLVTYSIANDVSALTNPCYTWGTTTAMASLAGHCSFSSASSETFSQMLMGMLLVQGGLILGMILGVLGLVRGHRSLLAAGAAIFFAECIPLVFSGVFVLAVLPAVIFLWAFKAGDGKFSLR